MPFKCQGENCEDTVLYENMKSHISTVCKNKIEANKENEDKIKTIYNAVLNKDQQAFAINKYIHQEHVLEPGLLNNLFIEEGEEPEVIGEPPVIAQ